MKKGKIPMIIVAVLLTAAMLAGCGAKTDNQAGTTSVKAASEQATTQAPTQEQLSQTELTYFCPGNGQPTDAALVEEEMNKILTDKIKATFKLNVIPWGEYINKMNVLSASGDAFDLCFSAHWENYMAMATKGAYADMTELLPKYASEYVAEMPAYVIEAAKIKGKQYAAPNLQGLAYSEKLFVNSEIYDKYQLPDSIKSMDDLDKYMDAIKKGEPGTTPFYMYTKNGIAGPFIHYMQTGLFPIGDQQSVGQYGADFKVINQYESDLAKTWYAWARKAYQNGWISKGAATDPGDDNMLKSKKFVIEFAASSPQFDASNWSAIAPVTMKPIDLGMSPTVLTGTCISTMYSISANSKNIDRSMMFINLINTDKKLYNTFCYGVENKHYVLKDGFVDLPDGVTADKLGYNPGMNWMYGFTYNAYLQKGADPNLGQKQLDFDRAAKPEPALGFTFDPTPVKTELANCQSVLEEYAPSLECGVIDQATGLDNLIAKLKAAGSDKIIEEKQKQLDQWRADNGK